MYAFGDAYLFVAAFGLLALVPTARRSAGSTLPRVLGRAVGGRRRSGDHRHRGSNLLRNRQRRRVAFRARRVGELLGAAHPAGADLAPTFLVVALIAPYRTPRLALFAAAAASSPSSGSQRSRWFVPLYFAG